LPITESCTLASRSITSAQDSPTSSDLRSPPRIASRASRGPEVDEIAELATAFGENGEMARSRRS
jgi:hypothetical protein